VADALSRQHEDAEVSALISYPIWQQGKELQMEDSKDPSLASIIDTIQENPASRPSFELKGGVLF
jgi:hypothetical protein